MLPTKAAMDHAGAGRTPFYPLGRTIPATASWRLSRMRKGDTWRRTVTVPGEAAGYYMAAVVADANGPASALGPYLSDESYDQAWMLVSETGGGLTEAFEDSVFAEGVVPMPGPFTTVAGLLAREADDEHEVMRVEVTYLDGAVRRAAVGARVRAWLSTDGWDTTGAAFIRYVPESGVVEFPCPTEGWPMFRGRMELPETDYVQGRDKWINRWVAHRSQCHPTEVRSSKGGPAWTYLAWRNLSEAIPVINDRFGYERKRINWKIDRGRRRSYYYRGLRGWGEKIVFGEAGLAQPMGCRARVHARSAPQVDGRDVGAVRGVLAGPATELLSPDVLRLRLRGGARQLRRVGGVAQREGPQLRGRDGSGHS